MPPLPPRREPKVTEGDVRRSIEIALNKQGLVRVMLNAQYSGPARGGYTRAGLGTGTADLVGYVIGSGRFFALEVKTGSGKVSAEQAAWIEQTNREGGYAGVARTPKEAEHHAREATLDLSWFKRLTTWFRKAWLAQGADYDLLPRP